MTEPEAYDVALKYIQQKNIMHYGCSYQGSWLERDLRLGGKFPKGRRRKVWYFQFALLEKEPDTVVCGGEYIVCVDDDTGICGHFASL
jgi:hypothetical protein